MKKETKNIIAFGLFIIGAILAIIGCFKPGFNLTWIIGILLMLSVKLFK